MRRPTDTTHNALVLVKSLLSKSIKRSPMLQPIHCDIQLYSAMFGERWRAASPIAFTLGFAGMQ